MALALLSITKAADNGISFLLWGVEACGFRVSKGRTSLPGSKRHGSLVPKMQKGRVLGLLSHSIALGVPVAEAPGFHQTPKAKSGFWG